MADELEEEVREATRDLIASKPDGLVWADLQEMGWFELVEESPSLAIGALFEGLGQSPAGSDALDAAVLVAVTDAGADLSLEAPPAVVYYRPGRHDVGSIGVDGATDLDGIVLSRADAPETLLTPAWACGRLDDSRCAGRFGGDVGTLGRRRPLVAASPRAADSVACASASSVRVRRGDEPGGAQGGGPRIHRAGPRHSRRRRRAGDQSEAVRTCHRELPGGSAPPHRHRGGARRVQLP